MTYKILPYAPTYFGPYRCNMLALKTNQKGRVLLRPPSWWGQFGGPTMTWAKIEMATQIRGTEAITPIQYA